jgi:hypothetical protein
VKDDFAKVGAVLRHGACASLVKSNVMALPNPSRTIFPWPWRTTKVLLVTALQPNAYRRPSMPLPSNPSSSKKLLGGIREPQEEP